MPDSPFEPDSTSPEAEEVSAEVIAEREGEDTPTRQLFDRITAEIRKIYVGQEELVTGTLVALFSNGHVLIFHRRIDKTTKRRSVGRAL